MSLRWLDLFRDSDGFPGLLLMVPLGLVVWAILAYPARKESHRLVVACILGLVIFVGVFLYLAVCATYPKPGTDIDWMDVGFEILFVLSILEGVRRLVREG